MSKGRESPGDFLAAFRDNLIAAIVHPNTIYSPQLGCGVYDKPHVREIAAEIFGLHAKGLEKIRHMPASGKGVVVATSAVNKANCILSTLHRARGIGLETDIYEVYPTGMEDQDKPSGMISFGKLADSVDYGIRVFPLPAIDSPDIGSQVLHLPQDNGQMTIASLKPGLVVTTDVRYGIYKGGRQLILGKPDNADLGKANLQALLGGGTGNPEDLTPLVCETGFTLAFPGEFALAATLFHVLSLKKFNPRIGAHYNEQSVLYTNNAAGLDVCDLVTRGGLAGVNGLEFDKYPRELAFLVHNLAKGFPHFIFALLGIVENGKINPEFIWKLLDSGDQHRGLNRNLPRSLTDPLERLGIARRNIYELMGMPTPPALLGTLEAIREFGFADDSSNPEECPRVYGRLLDGAFHYLCFPSK